MERVRTFFSFRLIVLLPLFSLTIGELRGQRKKQEVKVNTTNVKLFPISAKTLLEAGKQEQALELYERYVQSHPEDTRVIQETARTAFLLGYYRKAYKYFLQLDQKSPNDLPTLYYIVLCIDKLREFDKRADALKAFQEAGGNPTFFDKKKHEPTSPLTHSNLWKITPQRKANSKFSDIAAYPDPRDESAFIFASNRRKYDPRKLDGGQVSFNMYISLNNNKEIIPLKGTVRGEALYKGPATLSPDGTELLVSQSHKKNYYKVAIKHNQYFPGTYIYPIKSGYDLGQAVPFPHNSPTHTVAHAFLDRGKKTLYFSSDIPGGYGGSDIYKSIRQTDGTWSEPENLGFHVNSPGADLYPCTDEQGRLYFSSDRAEGKGGLDIFCLDPPEEGNEFQTPYPLLELNTEFNDFALYFARNGKYAFFSSDRTGSKGMDDIYRIDFMLLSVTTQVQRKDGSRIEESTMHIKTREGQLIKKIELFGKPKRISLPKYKNFIVTTLANGFRPSIDTFSATQKSWKVTLQISDSILTQKELAISMATKGMVLMPQKASMDSLAQELEQAKFDARVAVKEAEKEQMEHVTSPFATEKELLAKQRLAATQMRLDSLNNLPQKQGNSAIQFSVYIPDDFRIPDSLKYDSLVILEIRHFTFRFNSDELTNHDKDLLQKTVKILQRFPILKIQIISHSDAIGNAAYNLSLSERRANSVKRELESNGISASRLQIKPMGETKPANECKDGVPCLREKHKENRRTEFLLIGENGEPVRYMKMPKSDELVYCQGTPDVEIEPQCIYTARLKRSTRMLKDWEVYNGEEQLYITPGDGYIDYSIRVFDSEKETAKYLIIQQERVWNNSQITKICF